MVDRPPSRTFLRLFMAAYFCAGVGYVVSATFIVAIVDKLPGLAGNGSKTFLVLGLAAAPACIIWDLIARRVGDMNALIIAPAITGLLAEGEGVYNNGLYLAAVMMVLGSLLILLLKTRSRRELVPVSDPQP